MLDGADFFAAQHALVCEATNPASNGDPCRAGSRCGEDRDHEDMIRMPIASVDGDDEQLPRFVGVSGPARC